MSTLRSRPPTQVRKLCEAAPFQKRWRPLLGWDVARVALLGVANLATLIILQAVARLNLARIGVAILICYFDLGHAAFRARLVELVKHAVAKSGDIIDRIKDIEEVHNRPDTQLADPMVVANKLRNIGLHTLGVNLGRAVNEVTAEMLLRFGESIGISGDLGATCVFQGDVPAAIFASNHNALARQIREENDALCCHFIEPLTKFETAPIALVQQHAGWPGIGIPSGRFLSTSNASQSLDVAIERLMLKNS